MRVELFKKCQGRRHIISRMEHADQHGTVNSQVHGGFGCWNGFPFSPSLAVVSKKDGG